MMLLLFFTFLYYCMLYSLTWVSFWISDRGLSLHRMMGYTLNNIVQDDAVRVAPTYLLAPTSGHCDITATSDCQIMHLQHTPSCYLEIISLVKAHTCLAIILDGCAVSRHTLPTIKPQLLVLQLDWSQVLVDVDGRLLCTAA